MSWRVREPTKVFARGASLRRRVAYSLAIVRLILVPVILLSIYYLFAVSSIVDRIVSVDAPVATLAQRAYQEMNEARRSERDFLLLHDPADVEENRQALARLEQIVVTCVNLQPEESKTIEQIQYEVGVYRDRFEGIVGRMGKPVEAPRERLQRVVRAYSKDLNELLTHANNYSRGKLVAELRNRVGSFDAQITATIEAENPALHATTSDLRQSSNKILELTSGLEKRSWERVQREHEEARKLVHRAEWVLIIVSGFTLLLSVWVSFVLPRAVVRPLLDLKAAVDRAASGNYEIEFDVQGEGEAVQLANSVRKLIAHVREKKNNSGKADAP
jgi:CHASE3 domain sensor protein